MNKTPKQARRGRRFDEATCCAFVDALRRLHAKGYTRLSANCLANEMWPNARSNNAHGQSHNMAAGIAGQMLRSIRGCYEIENRVWEIVPEFISHNAEHIHSEPTSQDNE